MPWQVLLFFRKEELVMSKYVGTALCIIYGHQLLARVSDRTLTACLCCGLSYRSSNPPYGPSEHAANSTQTLKAQLIRFMGPLIKWVRRRPFFRCTSYRRQSSPGALTIPSQSTMDASAIVAELISLYVATSAEHNSSLRAFHHIGLH